MSQRSADANDLKDVPAIAIRFPAERVKGRASGWVRTLLIAAIAWTGTVSLAGPPDQLTFIPEQGSRQRDSGTGWLPQPVQTLTGTIVQYDAQQIAIRHLPSGSITRIRVENLLWVQPGWQDGDEILGLEDYRDGNYAKALPRLLKAARETSPRWRQQWLLVRAATAAFEAQQVSFGFKLISKLSTPRLPAPMLGQLPITWIPTPSKLKRDSPARERLTASVPITRLIAASRLQGNPNGAARTDQILLALATDRSAPLVAKLADVLRWRKIPPPQVQKTLPRWQAKMNRLPASVVWGPMLVAAERCEASGNQTDAIELWLAGSLLAPAQHHPQVKLAKTRSTALLRFLELDPSGLND